MEWKGDNLHFKNRVLTTGCGIYWGCGIGYTALRMWIDEIFDKNPRLIRIGLSTWSGNERMMKLAEKIGLRKEAVYRKARIVDDKYYDSVSYGVLKEEWQKQRNKELLHNEFLISDFWETERMIIRDTSIEDIDKVQEIYMHSRSMEGWTRNDEFTNDYVVNGFNKGNLPPNGMKKFYKIQSIIHKDSSRIIGFMEFYHGYPQKEVLYIATLLFGEDYRNNRYGQEVMNQLLKQAVELGFSKARLGVTLKNWQGIYFWTKLGFDAISKYCGDKVLTKDSFALLELEKNLKM